MTRKHFKTIAQTIKNHGFLSDFEKELFVKEISKICYDSNPRFNYKKFYDACFE